MTFSLEHNDFMNRVFDSSPSIFGFLFSFYRLLNPFINSYTFFEKSGSKNISKSHFKIKSHIYYADKNIDRINYKNNKCHNIF